MPLAGGRRVGGGRAHAKMTSELMQRCGENWWSCRRNMGSWWIFDQIIVASVMAVVAVNWIQLESSDLATMASMADVFTSGRT